MKHIRFALARQALTVACASIAIAGVGYVFAAPTAPPPGTTVSLPLTRGSGAETKTGPLTIQGALTASGGLSVSGGSGLCLSGVCKTAWPTASIQSGTAYPTPGTQTFGYNSSSSYDSSLYTYYTYGSTQYGYSNGGNYITPQNFSIPHTISGGVPVSVNLPPVYCYSTYGSTNFQQAYCGTPYCQSTQYTYATNVTATISGNTVYINGTCRFYSGGGSYYGAAKPASFSVTYLY